MSIVKRSFGKRWYSVLLVVSLVWWSSAAAFAGGDDDEARRTCEEAMTKCLGDAIWAAFFSGWISIVLFVEICFAGYAFCLKYVRIDG